MDAYHDSIDEWGESKEMFKTSPTTMINLPGFTTDNEKKWIFMAKDGFKKKKSTIDRPITAGTTKTLMKASARNSRPKSSDGGRRTGMRSRKDAPKGSHNLSISPFVDQKEKALPDISLKASSEKFEPHWTSDVLRFFGFFQIKRQWGEGFTPIGSPTIEDMIVRPVIIYHFLQDGTTEIKEEMQKNSGMVSGLFYRRGHLERDDDYNGGAVCPEDMCVGRNLYVVGREIKLCDADKFTRDWYKKNHDMDMPIALDVPGEYRPDLAAQFATGFVSTIGPGSKPRGRVTYNSKEKAERREKAYKFMNFSESKLHFVCCQLDKSLSVNERMSRKTLSECKKFLLNYYRGDSHTEIAYIKNEETLRDEPALLLKKTLLEKNWKDVKKGRDPIHYGPEDYLVGNIVDVYGRLLLIVDCDDETKRFYSDELGIKQVGIDVSVIPPPKIIHPVPGRQDGFLTIGSDRDTLATVYGQPKPTVDVDKMQRNAGRELRCVVEKISHDGKNINELGCTYLLTFFLEDDSLSIYRISEPNTGLTSTTWLKRGVYQNLLPNDATKARNFIPQDIYLGNVLCVNTVEFRITEMDNLSVRFCEGYPDIYPLFDTFTVTRRVLAKVVRGEVDLRGTLQRADVEKKRLISKEVFFQELDAMGLCGALKDQEIMTLLRRFEDNGLYHYHELCDFLAHVFSVTHKMVLPPSEDREAHFLHTLLCKETQWRRAFRKDRTSDNGFIALDRLVWTLTFFTSLWSSHRL